MRDDKCIPARSDKELFEATLPFAEESRFRSWWCVGSTFSALVAALIAAALVSWWPLRVAASVVGGLLLVRAFILFHDFHHGSLLRKSRLANALFFFYGLVALTPPRNWRHSHNFHHANVGKPIASHDSEYSFLTSDIGSFPLVTTDKWQHASTLQKIHYRITRHVVTIVCAYATVFFGSLCLIPLLQSPRKNWESVLSLLTHAGFIAGLWIFGGWAVLFFSFLLPFTIAGMAGAYLFFAQHNFEGMRVVPIAEWNHYRGSLESSSYLKLGPIMSWFTGNIGYHHVHHVNSRIPFYRLPEAMAAIPELQQPFITTLRPRDVLTCLRLNLWDPRKQQLVRFRDAANLTSARNNGSGA
jgi:omega-6 fatty acid desaturase (delta-12 desaturase)